MLTIDRIETVYNHAILVLRELSLHVPEGKIVALLGANGAGKSTTLKAISGLIRSENGAVTKGKIEFMGREITGESPENIVRMGIFQVMEGRRVFEDLTVADNIHVGGYTRKDRDGFRRDIELVYDLFPRLSERRHQLAGYLSGGEQQMLAIGRGLMASPKLLLLDEPSLGIAPILVQEIFQLIRKINQEKKTTILLVEQNANVALAIADQAHVMEGGKIVLSGSAEELKANNEVREFYLGFSEHGGKRSTGIPPDEALERSQPLETHAMSLTSIIVHLDSGRATEARIVLAAGYAAKHGARLIGVYADMEGAPDGKGIAEANFREETARLGIPAELHAIEVSELQTDPFETLRHHFHTADLLVIGQPHPEGDGAGTGHDLPERLILACGRPVLTVPFAGKFTTFGERALVAWKDGRESTRALHDAIPILKQAHRVHILRVLMARDSGTPEGLPPYLVSFLAGHGIKARPEEILAPDFPLGDLLLNHACEEGIDLLVMGAYGMAPSGRPVLGKTARHILRHMTLPVLMSH